MDSVFLKSNLYQKTPTLYGDLGTFATGAISIEEDFDDTIRANSFPIGSYSVATDFRGRVNTFFREFRMTVQQLVDHFGKNEATTGKADWSVFSDYVRQQYERGNYQTWIDVCHLIYPNPEHDPRRVSSKFKKFASVYYERGSSKTSNYDDERMLRESGYDMFPIMVPRWEVAGEDTYGTNCPGMTALGDIKALQLMQKRKSQAIEKMVNPAMKGPTSMQNVKSSILPGDMTYVDERGDMQFKPVHDVNINLGDLRLDIQDHQQRVGLLEGRQGPLRPRMPCVRRAPGGQVGGRHGRQALRGGPQREDLRDHAGTRLGGGPQRIFLVAHPVRPHHRVEVGRGVHGVGQRPPERTRRTSARKRPRLRLL